MTGDDFVALRAEEDRLLRELVRIHEARREEMRPVIERLIEIRVALPIPVGIVGYGAFHAASVEAAADLVEALDAAGRADLGMPPT